MGDPIKDAANNPAKPEAAADPKAADFAKQTQEILTQLTEQILKPQAEQLKNVQTEQARQREQLEKSNKQLDADRAAAAAKSADDEWAKWGEWQKKDPVGAIKALMEAQSKLAEQRANEIADQKIREAGNRQTQHNETITKFLETNKTKWDEIQPHVNELLKKYPGQTADNPLVLETALQKLNVKKLEEAKEPPDVPGGQRGGVQGGVKQTPRDEVTDAFKNALNIKSPADL